MGSPMVGQKPILILASLFNQERTALDIIKAVKKDAGVKISQGGIYTQLARLESAGLVKGFYGTDEPESRGGRRRRYYRLTGAGERTVTGVDRVLTAARAGGGGP